LLQRNPSAKAAAKIVLDDEARVKQNKKKNERKRQKKAEMRQDAKRAKSQDDSE